ncbi:hypothetical protein [Nocardia sp. NPDC052566]|uniref:hypothetical protein n=1 Tax=Nocardia sp. NPDC052566 TaxID=3364330 RepID=UPI0037C56F24
MTSGAGHLLVDRRRARCPARESRKPARLINRLHREGQGAFAPRRTLPRIRLSTRVFDNRPVRPTYPLLTFCVVIVAIVVVLAILL